MTDPVRAAIEAHGGRIVYSVTLDEHGRTVGGDLNSQRKPYRCASCGERGHIATRCNGPGLPPQPTERERRRIAAADRVREVIARYAPGDDLDEARRVIAERIAARSKR